MADRIIRHFMWMLIPPAMGLAYLSSAVAQTEQVLHSFTGAPDGANPGVGLVADKQGNLYGTSAYGGFTGGAKITGCGTVFELKPTGAGFTESVIWAFQSVSATDGCVPQSSLVMDAAGNLYGTTSAGGIYTAGCGATAPGCGTAFELSPDSSGGWTEKLLWNFGNGADGSVPMAGLTFDTAGNLYGTTLGGGGPGCGFGAAGTVFQLSPNLDESWSETVLHAFGCYTSGISDGIYLEAGVTLDSAGNIYGTTLWGGKFSTLACTPFGCGTVFELEKASGWKEIQLYLFSGHSDGAWPRGSLVLDKAGRLYGTASIGGSGVDYAGHGVVFQLAKTNSSWTQSVIHAFGSSSGDGATPYAGLVPRGGRFYGTTTSGGASNLGAIFELTHNASGWTETVLYSFSGGTDGADPNGGVAFYPTCTASCSLYGTTYNGGGSNSGTIFELTPP